MTLLLALLGAVAGCGLLLVGGGFGMLPIEVPSALSALTRRGLGAPRHEWMQPVEDHKDEASRRYVMVATALGAGSAAFIVTRWPMSVPIAVLGAIGMQGLGGGSAKRVITRLEAIASWTEMLRDTLAGASGLNQAIMATGSIAPHPIRKEVRALTSRISAGLPLASSLVLFGEELAEPAADTVIACLVMAATERAQRLGELLGAMAEATREEVTMRASVEASRASGRSAVRSVTGFSVGFFALMAVFARSYMAPYRTASGQLVLGLVACVFGLGLWLMAAMVRPAAFSRLHAAIPEEAAAL